MSEPCCLAGKCAGFCERYRQFMPEPLRRICAGEDPKITPEQTLAYREAWDRDGGPLGLKKVAQAAAAGQAAPTRRGQTPPATRGPCAFLGEWTGRLCQG